METKLAFGPIAELETEALVVLVADREPKLEGTLAVIDQAAQGAVRELLESGEFSGRALETALLYRPAGLKAKRLLLIGAGKNTPGVFELRRIATVAARQLKGKNLHRIAILAPAGLDPETAARAIVTGVDGANFEPDTYKKDRKEDRRIDELTLAFPGAGESNRLTQAVNEAQLIAAGLRFARDLANEPGNKLTPTILAQRAQAMAQQVGLPCEVIDEKRARELKMGAFLSVAQGSAEPPAMIIIRYQGNPDPKAPVLGYIGKGITFDTGGISIKPAAGMEWMKCDMAGGAAMLGAVQAIATMKLKVNILAIVAAAENMPGGRAQKPGDVQISMSGKSIEVLNTDAEGRLVLSDALAYAQQLGATHLIDAATLTGACVVALGQVNSGVFANNEEYYQTFQKAVAQAGEKMWRLPLDDEYFEQIRGSVGDILNTGGRWGGAITAAMFLREFVEDKPWIHLDIAGTAWSEDNKPWQPKGPTGAAVYSLVELARLFSA